MTVRKRVSGIFDVLLEGNTLDLSQSGAFIKTEGWHFFEPNELTKPIFFLPPDFTGVDTPIGLQGDAVITRIDRENQGIAVEFVKSFREFEQIDLPDLLLIFPNMFLTHFRERHLGGQDLGG
ncbi:MAG: PilZ domain-containing protein [Deltaproteobacteria bacterium]|nr:MAG: PilZ domain-containing protein [Deltaproteobacteria bacterium]